MLEGHIRGTLPQDAFPFTKMSPDDAHILQNDQPSAASLRSAKPTWAKSRLASVEPRQRVIVFIAGGATYSEARACYEISNKTSREVFLVTSHMMKPAFFLRQVGDLSQPRRNLRLPIDQAPPKAPSHLFEKPEPPKLVPPPANVKPLPASPRIGPAAPPKPPTAAMGAINLNTPSAPPSKHSPALSQSGSKYGKDEKDKERKKKKLHLFSSKH